MGPEIVTFALILSTMFNPSLSDTDWDDVVVIREGSSATLVCIDTPVSESITIDWKFQKPITEEWISVLSTNEETKFLEDVPKYHVYLKDPNFKTTGDFSVLFQPRLEDSGLYSCLIGQKKRLKLTVILLAVLSVTIGPAPPVPVNSTLRLITQISPKFANVRITWLSPEGITMRSENLPKTHTLTKLPLFQKSDGGAYVCVVQAWAKSRSTLFAFNVDVNVDVDKVASFNTIQDGPVISTATQILTPLTLTCPEVPWDYVELYWVPHDTSKEDNMRLVYQYDRWRNFTLLTNESTRFQMAESPNNANGGIFSTSILQRRPELKDGGLYICKVFLNDNVFIQSTMLSIMRAKIVEHPSQLELVCVFTERSHVRSVVWRHHNESYRLQMFNNGPGSVKTIVPLPITPNTAGNYSCILELRNGQVFQAIQAVPQPLEGHVIVIQKGQDVTERIQARATWRPSTLSTYNTTEATSMDVTNPSMLPSISALLLLVPLVAAAVGVLLWRQKHISERGIEQSLSVHLSDTENIYENPDVREAPPKDSVYMDLNPRRVDDIYKELERYEECQN